MHRIPFASAFVLALAVPALSAPAVAQTPILHTPVIAAHHGTRALEVADVNGDGKPDVIVVDAANHLSSQLGDGLGGFGAPVAQGLDGFPHVGLAAADFDGDGLADGVLTKVVESSVDWLELRLGLGDGSFDVPLNLALAGEAADVDALDIDGDGDADIVTGALDQQRISIFRGDGAGGLAPRQDVAAQFFAQDVAQGDLDDDGDLDIVVSASVGQSIVVLLASGPTSYAAPISHSLPIGPVDVQLGDVDADGDLDAFAGSEWAHAALLHGDGKGGLGEAQVATFGNGLLHAAVADTDEDGLQEGLFTAQGDDQLLVIHFDEPFSWFNARRFGTGDVPTDVVGRDLNGDGDVDLLVASGNFDATLTLLAGDGQGGFAGPFGGVDTPVDVAFGDLDADGLPELASINATNGPRQLTVWNNHGLGVFGEQQDKPGGSVMSGVAMADVDADGDADVFACDTSKHVFLHRSNGDGTLAPVFTLLLADNPTELQAADLDGDGDADAVITTTKSPPPGRLVTLISPGNGTLVETSTQPLQGDDQTLLLTDVTGDGELDAVLAAFGGAGHVLVFPGVGDGSFGTAVSSPNFVSARALAAGDLDEDGDPDLVATSETNGAVSVLRNDGGGAFTALALVSTLAGVPSGLEIADFDRDGHLDIVAACGASVSIGAGSLALFLGDGDLVLGAPLKIPAPYRPAGTAVADADGDGAPDLGLACFGDQVAVFLNARGPWEPLGHALGGTLGLPRQTGEGTLAQGEFFRFALHDARPFANAGHFVGLSAINAPFKGGVLVPAPLLLNYPLPVNANGDLVLQGNWPIAAPGVALWFQFLVQDPLAPKGWALSTALKGTLP